ncbi:MAG: peptidoglycan DD-metalloendopeptidase family protein [Alphaproteobacteria bacterium]
MKWLLTLLLLTLPANAQNAKTPLPQIAFPLDCTLGKDCWVVNTVDTDPAKDSAKDFQCGAKTYDNHKGTDFAIRSRTEMEKGVNVLAVKNGKVLRLRNTEDDTYKTKEQQKSITAANKDCGNGIIIDHGQGLQSYYCHLKQNSIRVKIGDEVKAGQPIAQIGHSGFTQFPHLHLTILWEGGHIDPFTGHLMEEGCGKFKDNMWHPDITPEPIAIFDGGFTNTAPDFSIIKASKHVHPETLSKTGHALVYWAGFYHSQASDKITLTITDPNGKIFAKREATLEKSQIRAYQYTGRTLAGKDMPAGIYTGTITFERNDHPVKTQIHTTELK